MKLGEALILLDRHFPNADPDLYTPPADGRLRLVLRHPGGKAFFDATTCADIGNAFLAIADHLARRAP